jgi:hypothetical protein
MYARSSRSSSAFKPVLKVIYEEQPERPSSLYEQAIIAQFSYWAA